MSTCNVFGQQCLMGCHSLPRQLIHHMILYLILLNFLIACSVISDFSLYWYVSPVSVAACLFTIMLLFFFFSFCLTNLLLHSWPPPFSCNQSFSRSSSLSASLPSSSYSPLPTFSLTALLSSLTSHVR